MATYRVKLDLFEGPLDLLLHLVKKNEVDIADIPIAAITDQYLEYLAVLEEMNLDIAGEFLVMAATLMYIKSRCLLPQAEIPGEEDEEEGDPRAALIERLREYQRFRDVAMQLGGRDILARDVFARPKTGVVPGTDELETAVEFRDVSLGSLLDALRQVLRRTIAAPVHEVVSESLTVRECMGPVLEHLRPAGRTTFDSLFPDGVTRHRVIVTFLALLELMRLGVVRVYQADHFADVSIVLGVPSVDAALAAIQQRELEGMLVMGEA